MKNTQIIKDNVKPILTPVEKVRYTQASSFFIKGMTGYLVNYVKGVKLMVDTRLVSEHYSKLYKEQANLFVERFNEHNKEVEKEKSKIIPLLLVFSAGGYLLYKSLRYVSEKFVKLLKHINHFILLIYLLGKQESSKVLSYTQTWTGRIFGGNGIDVQGIIGDAIKNIPDLISGMFNFIVNSFDWLLNKSELFSSIFIDVAKRAYNASFSSSWGWVIGKVFDRAKVKQKRISMSLGVAKFGPEFNNFIIKLNLEYKKAILHSLRGESGGREWIIEHEITTTNSRHFNLEQASVVQDMYELNSFLITITKDSRELYHYNNHEILVELQNRIPAFNTRATKHGMTFFAIPDFSSDASFLLSSIKGNIDDFIHNTPTRGEYVGTFIMLSTNPYIIATNNKMIELLKKYAHHFNTSDYLKFIRNERINMFNNAWDIPPNVHWFYALYFATLVYFKEHLETQSIIQGIRFHSRFLQSYVDNIRDTLLQHNLTLLRKNRGELYDYFKMYDEGVYSFDDYIDKTVLWLNRQRRSFRNTKLGQLVINFIPNTRYDFNLSDKVNWRRMFGIPKIERQLILIKNIFRNIQQQVKYGVSYADGNIYYFSDLVSDASLLINKFDNLYQGVFEERDREKNPQGIEVGTHDDSGIGRNAEDTLGNKSSLAYVAKLITLLYVDFRRNVNNLRRDRNTLITVFLQKLKYLYTCKLIYEKFKETKKLDSDYKNILINH